jgi:hypothetical protein
MTSINDATPEQEEEYIKEKLSHTHYGEITHVPWQHNLGHQEPFYNYNYMHNQSQIRSRGYGIGNAIVNLPPGVPDAYYTQPGSPYNAASIRDISPIGDLDAATGGGRPYKNELWKKRLSTAAEMAAEEEETIVSFPLTNEQTTTAAASTGKRLSMKEQAILARGGTITK